MLERTILSFSYGRQALLPCPSPMGTGHDIVYGLWNCSAGVLGLLQEEALSDVAVAGVALTHLASWLSPTGCPQAAPGHAPGVDPVHPVPTGGWLRSNNPSN